MQKYHSVDDVFEARRTGKNLSEVFDKILNSPYVLERIDNPFDIIPDFDNSDYLDASTAMWATLPVELQMKLAKAYQTWYAKHLGMPHAGGLLDISRPPNRDLFCMEARLIPPMRFLYGDTNKKAILINKPYWMGTYEVTMGEWDFVMSENSPARDDLRAGQHFAVYPVTYSEALEFCLRSKMELPSAEEWEMACRAGTTTEYYFGDNAEELGDYAWYWQNSSNYVHPIGKRKANAFGLFDMLGNLEEWCTAEDKKARGVRGGSSSSMNFRCSSSYMRFERDRNITHERIGFRVIRKI